MLPLHRYYSNIYKLWHAKLVCKLTSRLDSASTSGMSLLSTNLQHLTRLDFKTRLCMYAIGKAEIYMTYVVTTVYRKSSKR